MGRLEEYLNSEILPRYDGFDSAHRREHALKVMEQGLYLAQFYDVDRAMVLTACACHDIGLSEGRENHHLSSGRMIRELPLSEWFNPEQIETIAQAAEDHRASSEKEPRSIYGRIVAEADRQIDADTVVKRTIQYGADHYPELSKEEHWQRMLDHLHEKYAEGGYLKLWIPESPNSAQLKKLRTLIQDKTTLRSLFDRYWYSEAKASLKR